MIRPILTSCCIAALTVFPAFADEISLAPIAELNWDVTPEGVGFAPLHGDRFAGAYMAMVRLPAGLISPAHVKSADMFGIMVDGTMTHVQVGDDAATAPHLTAGDFYHIPAGLPHVSACISDTPCITFLYQDGAFDFTPVAQ